MTGSISTLVVWLGRSVDCWVVGSKRLRVRFQTRSGRLAPPVPGLRCICPTVFFARADGTTLRLLYLFASAGKAYSDRQYWKPLVPDKRGRSGICLVADAPMKRDGGVGRTQLTNRKPILLLRFAGLLLLRYTARALS